MLVIAIINSLKKTIKKVLKMVVNTIKSYKIKDIEQQLNEV